MRESNSRSFDFGSNALATWSRVAHERTYSFNRCWSVTVLYSADILWVWTFQALKQYIFNSIPNNSLARNIHFYSLYLQSVYNEQNNIPEFLCFFGYLSLIIFEHPTPISLKYISKTHHYTEAEGGKMTPELAYFVLNQALLSLSETAPWTYLLLYFISAKVTSQWESPVKMFHQETIMAHLLR